MGESPRLRDRPAWRVGIPDHMIQRRTIGGTRREGYYHVPASSVIRFEQSKRTAVKMAVTDAHIAAEVPQWRPYLRETARICTVERTIATAAGGGAS